MSSTNYSSCEKTRMIDLSYGYKNVGPTFVRFVAIHVCDRRLYDRQDRVAFNAMQRGKNEIVAKTNAAELQ